MTTMFMDITLLSWYVHTLASRNKENGARPEAVCANVPYYG